MDKKEKMISDKIEKYIISAIDEYDGSYTLEDNSFRDLLSMGELVDRLSIVNFKLYNLKNKVMELTDDIEFRAWAAEEDVKLVLERSRLKKCIDEKFIEFISGKNNFNPEIKDYGNN
jgi:hypothetical protein